MSSGGEDRTGHCSQKSEREKKKKFVTTEPVVWFYLWIAVSCITAVAVSCKAVKLCCHNVVRAYTAVAASSFGAKQLGVFFQPDDLFAGGKMVSTVSIWYYQVCMYYSYEVWISYKYVPQFTNFVIGSPEFSFSRLLYGWSEANCLRDNWLRTAYETIDYFTMPSNGRLDLIGLGVRSSCFCTGVRTQQQQSPSTILLHQVRVPQ